MDLQNKLTFERAEQQKAEATEYVREQLKYSVYLNDPKTNPCNYEKQLGNKLPILSFETKLRKLNPNLFVISNSWNNNKKYLYFQFHEDRIFISAFDVLQDGCVAEHSIMSAKTEEVPDLDFVRTKDVGGVSVSHIDKKDIPSSKLVDGELVFEGKGNPGFKEVDTVYTEAFRGWRTVLSYIVRAGVATPAECEAVFGVANTPQWKRTMGKGQVVELF